jgi:peroxiredoxin
MKFLPRFLAGWVAFGLALLGRAEEGVNDLKIGDAAPDFALVGIDDKIHRLADFRDGKVLVVFFTSNHCPTSHGAAARLKDFLAEFRPRGMTFVAINPNHPDGLSIDELGYSKYNDGFEDMKRYAADEGFDFPYLYDGDTQAVARAYGCLATPHVFIFDADRKLRYKGRFDDSPYADAGTVKSPDARNAVAALLAGLEVPVAVTKPHGCSTKWISKQAGIARKMANWDRTPVEVDTIDAGGVAALRRGGTGNVRLYNVWATWCAPCVEEFPELVAISRRFDMRNFEFISISMDRPADAAKVKEFLERNGAGLSGRLRRSVRMEGRRSNSYLFTGGGMEDLMKELDPEWPGGIPHTVLVDEGGRIIWRHSGPVNGAELRDRVLAHLGNYYKP